MKNRFDDYTLLAGGSGLRGSLWQGPDHLLVIEGKGFVMPFRETYRRIDYKNIQALTFARTARMLWLALFMLLMLASAGIGLGFAIWQLGVHPVTFFSGAVCFVFAALLFVHLWKGQTCRCALQTAVLSLRLKPLRREKKALAVLQQLASICTTHQGGLSAEALAAHDSSAPPASHGLKPLWPGSRLAQFGFLTLFAWGAMVAGEMFITSVPYLVTHIVLALTAFVLLIATLANALRHRAPSGLAGVLWASLANLLVTGMGSYILIIVLSISASVKSGTGSIDGQNVFLSLSTQNLGSAGGVGWLVIVLGLIGAVLGLAGFMLSSKRLASGETGVPAPQMPPNQKPPG